MYDKLVFNIINTLIFQMVKKEENESTFLIFQRRHHTIRVNIKDIKKLYKIDKCRLPQIPKYRINISSIS